MNKSLLDTDTFSEILKRKNKKVIKKAIEYYKHFNSYTISTITVIEIIKGLQKLQNEKKYREFLHYQRIKSLGYELKIENWKV